MTTLKGWITTTFLVVSLLLSTTGANAGIIIAGATDDPCTEPTKVDTTATADDLGGIIIAGITGIIIAGFGGIIIAGAADEPQTNCGIIIAG